MVYNVDSIFYTSEHNLGKRRKNMNLVAVIVSMVFLIAVGLAGLIGALRGRKYKWEYSLARIIGVIISAIIAAIISAVVANLAITSVANMVLNGNMLGDIGEMLKELPSGIAALSALAAMLVAPILFIPLFIIIKIIINIVTTLVMRSILNIATKKDKAPDDDKKFIERKHYRKKNEALIDHHVNILGGALGAVCSILVLCAFLVPLTGLLDFAGKVVPVAMHTLEEEDESGNMAIIGDIADGVCNNAATITVNLIGGKPLYGVMTTSSVDGEMANLNKESGFIAAVADTVLAMSNPNVDYATKANAIRRISPAFDRSVIARAVLTDVFSAAGEDWQAGRSFYGIKKISLGKDLNDISDAIIEVLATSNKENIKSDFKAIIGAIAVIVEDGLADDLEGNPMAILSKEETTAKLLDAFLEDERLDPLVDGVADFGVGMLLSSVKTPERKQDKFVAFVNAFCNVSGSDHEELSKAYARVFANFAIRDTEDHAGRAAVAYLAGGGEGMQTWLLNNVVSDAEDFAAKTQMVSKDMISLGNTPITDREHEAKALAHAFAVVYGLTTDIKGNAFEAKKMLATMGPALDSFAATETIGPEKTGWMLAAILQSDLVHDQMGFTTLEAIDSAASISANSNGKSYESIMTSLSGVVAMLEAASDKTKDTKEAVDKMLENLTPEAATVMQTMATPSVMQNYGVPEKSADASAAMISSTFGNLKEVPPEEYDKESAAVANMMNVMMSVTDKKAPSVFGGPDSATQMTEDEYVNNIMESTAMSKSVVETVYGDGDEPKNDPLNSGRKLSDTEKTNLVSSLDSKWQASAKDEETKKEIIAIGAMMNLPVEVSDEGVNMIVTETETESGNETENEIENGNETENENEAQA